jgi:hypothetical protein
MRSACFRISDDGILPAYSNAIVAGNTGPENGVGVFRASGGQTYLLNSNQMNLLVQVGTAALPQSNND